MAEMNDFKKDFVRRTRKLLSQNYNEIELEVTLLLNCLCGLVNMPIEEKKKVYDEKTEIFKENCVKKLQTLCIREDFHSRPYVNTFNDIRNSIAHFNIDVKNIDHEIKIIKLKAYSDERKHKVAFNIAISIENLKKFAEYVADEYLKLL